MKTIDTISFTQLFLHLSFTQLNSFGNAMNIEIFKLQTWLNQFE